MAAQIQVRPTEGLTYKVDDELIELLWKIKAGERVSWSDMSRACHVAQDVFARMARGVSAARPESLQALARTYGSRYHFTEAQVMKWGRVTGTEVPPDQTVAALLPERVTRRLEQLRDTLGDEDYRSLVDTLEQQVEMARRAWRLPDGDGAPDAR